MGSIGNSGNTVNKQIQEWKTNEVNAVVKELYKYRSQYEDSRTKSHMERIQVWNNIPNVYRYAVTTQYTPGMDDANRELFTNLANNLVDAHFQSLENKVKARIGNIVEIYNTGGRNDYIFVGDSGQRASIQVVYAGGHNKQRLHTRWTFNKLGKRGS